jgi:ribonuclease Z
MYFPIFVTSFIIMIKFSVTILGSSSATPTSERNPTAQLVNHRDKLFMIDCGEGTQVALRRMRIHFQRINHIFISHLHGDHFYGLIGLISSMHLLGRDHELHVYGPPELKDVIELQLKVSMTTLIYPLIFHATQSNVAEVIHENIHLQVISFPLNHRIATTGFLFREKVGLRKVIKEKALEIKIPAWAYEKIRQGEDFTGDDGIVHQNTELTLDPPPPRSYAFCSDTAYYEPVIQNIRNSDLLYHEATFMNDREANAKEKFHSTAAQAGKLARLAEVKKLLLGHFSARYDDLQPLLDEAKVEFAESYLAEEGITFEIPQVT